MDSQPNVPYQAYRSKRHSRNFSNPHLTPNVSPPPQARPPVAHANGQVLSEPIILRHRDFNVDSEKHLSINTNGRLPGTQRPVSMAASIPHYEKLALLSTTVLTSAAEPSSPSEHTTSTAASSDKHDTPPLPTLDIPSSPTITDPPFTNGSGKRVDPPDTVAGPSTASPGPSPKSVTHRKVTTFRHVPLRSSSARPSLPSSPLRPPGSHSRTASNLSSSTRQLNPSQQHSTQPPSRISSTTSTPLLGPNDGTTSTIPTLDLSSQSRVSSSSSSPRVVIPPPRASSLLNSNAPVPPPKPISPAPSQIQSPMSLSSAASSSASIPTVRHHTPTRTSAPYRPGFQPKGVYRPRTDEFIEARKNDRASGRIERTRLERRLEKLINLHFPHPDYQKEKVSQPGTGQSGARDRRQSSFFDLTFADLTSKSASDLWREVIQPQSTPGGKVDIRAAEQTITPWEDDASVSQCPICTASFHPITNRKHHCRLCGRIICSLPVKYPQRPQTCSLLFVADPVSGQIEEVGEGVDYGVRRRNTGTPQGKGKGKEGVLNDEEKFLKGVRVCRDCRPVLLRRQFIQEANRIPTFSKLYEAFIILEKEIEDALPQFQELMLSLSNEERPAPEASAARKRLVEAFTQYDALAKRIRKLPCPAGSGSSQDRVQLAVLSRANLFLQKNMFPLQALPNPRKASPKAASPDQNTSGSQLIDPDSEIAHALQPLLEQEALLESFVEEAKAHRKFEDAKTLKANLAEIRAEIDRILANAEGGMESDASRRGKAKPQS